MNDIINRMSQLFVDLVEAQDWDHPLAPTWIMTKYKNFVRICIGVPSIKENVYIKDGELSVGIWISSDDYDKIDHNKAYLVFHSIQEPKLSDIDDLVDEMWTEQTKDYGHCHITDSSFEDWSDEVMH